MKELYCEKSYHGKNSFSECYYKDSTKQEFHREDGPANIFYYSNGNVENEEYYEDGVRHRVDGPVAIYYYKNGKIHYIVS